MNGWVARREKREDSIGSSASSSVSSTARSPHWSTARSFPLPATSCSTDMSFSAGLRFVGELLKPKVPPVIPIGVGGVDGRCSSASWVAVDGRVSSVRRLTRLRPGEGAGAGLVEGREVASVAGLGGRSAVGLDVCSTVGLGVRSPASGFC